MAERQQQIDRKLDILKAQQVVNNYFVCTSNTWAGMGCVSPTGFGIWVFELSLS